MIIKFIILLVPFLCLIGWGIYLLFGLSDERQIGVIDLFIIVIPLFGVLSWNAYYFLELISKNGKKG